MSAFTPTQPSALTARDSLFMSTDGQPYVSSRAIAERFGKRHTHVLRIIKKLLADIQATEFAQPNIGLGCHHKSGFDRTNFRPISYPDANGQQRPEYHLSHDGFALVVMSFTGPEALAWKIAFIEAFKALEAELKAKDQLFLAALDKIRPCLRIVVEGGEQGLNRAQIGAQLDKSLAAVTYHRGQARKLGLRA
ncbi:MAG: Rha family transcriptional regulator [Kordiimonadaceae bacterium]|nr:Rha family transcriptional regulator [Kordiimonadaceae bacterium]PCJ37785.1 MAG: hypothetical protein COA75_03430 [Cellvibrionales bacterium]